MAVRNFLAGEAGIELARQASLFTRRTAKSDRKEIYPGVSPYLTSPLKRFFDVGMAGLLIFLLLPLLVLAALAVKWSSPGSAVFRQKRYGLGKAPFEILKFRSMHAECGADPAVPQACAGDPRVTSLGRFLRKSSVDELPQLINVLKGEMSLVGPRPHAIVHDEKYLAELPTYGERFSAIPGITGLAQVNGARGETPTLAHMQRRLHYDLEYVRTATFLLDLKIIARTAIDIVARRANVY